MTSAQAEQPDLLCSGATGLCQTTEYQRFSDVRDMCLRLRGEENEDAKSWIVGDWISRDIGDWLIGGHIGALIGIAWQVVLILQFVD